MYVNLRKFCKFEDRVESESSTKSLEFKSSSEDSEKKLVVKFNIFLDFGVLVAMNVDGPGVDGLGVDGVDYINSDNNIDDVECRSWSPAKFLRGTKRYLYIAVEYGKSRLYNLS
ncbi:hypothetical protein QTP88_026518 [Uroleucon formosanum]